GINSSSSRRKIHELEQAAAHAGIDSNAHVNTTPQRITSLWRASDAGCEACSHTGYEGVIAIAEVLAMSPNLQKAVLNHESAPAMHNLALKEGFVPMALDGLIKALRGQTTTAEVLRTSPI
ncbi:MAG TPA: type II/IV secretion system protein, partial [Candidatus Saccharimonadales bacterium]